MEIQRAVSIEKQSVDDTLNNSTYQIKNKLRDRGKTGLYPVISDFYSVEEALYGQLSGKAPFNNAGGDRYAAILSFFVGADYSGRNLPANGGHSFGRLDFGQHHPTILHQTIELYSEWISRASDLERMTADFMGWIKEESRNARTVYEDKSFTKFLREDPITIDSYVFNGFNAMAAGGADQASKYSFDDIGGYEEAVETLLKIGENIERISIRSKVAPKEILIPKGIFIYGPPGTGKTSLALAFCNHFNIPYEIVVGPDFRTEYVNQSANQLQKKFDKAAKEIKTGSDVYAIFMDEFEDIAKRRDSQMSEEDRKLIGVINNNMDGVKTMPGRIILAATNLPEKVDPAIKRRFDYEIKVGLPDSETRKKVFEKILNKYTRKVETKLGDIDYAKIANLTDGYSGGNIDTMIRKVLIRKAEEFDKSQAQTSPIVTTKDLVQIIQNEKCQG